MRILWLTDSTLTELTLLVLAFVLTAVIGLERQYRLKAAGFRTHTLVGLGSALFTLVSAYGFSGMTVPGTPVDPSRIAAQVVSGIGFLGAGVIFVRRDSISGLTTAASIWVTAAVGMACGANLPLLGVMTTILYLTSVGPLGRLTRHFHSVRPESRVILRYREGVGALRTTLTLAVTKGYEAVVTDTRSIGRQGAASCYEAVICLVNVPGAVAEPLLDDIAEIPGVMSARIAGLDVE